VQTYKSDAAKSGSTEVGSYRTDYARGHRYAIDGQKVTSVTTIMSNGWPKNLAKWGAECVSNYAIDNWAKLGRMPLSERIKKLNGAPWATMDRAAMKGTAIHQIAEKLLAGEQATVPEDVAKKVAACQRFLSDFDVKPVHVELPVFSRKHLYAGTSDLIADLADGQRWLLDWKSGKSGVFGDMSYQLSAYRYADFYVDAEGNEIPVPEVDAVGIVWLREDGEYELVPLESNQRVFREFIAIMRVAEAAENSRSYVGMPVAPPVVIGGAA
jgi:hypothetical protein